METLNKKTIYSVFILIAFFLLLFYFYNKLPNNFKYLKIADTILKVEVASTPELQTQGLSGRNGLNENDGMLFVFDHSGVYYFWMKDMNFSIDMIWLDKNLKVIYIEKNATPESYPKTFGPNKDSLYVLEVVPGFSDKHNLKEGDSVLLH